VKAMKNPLLRGGIRILAILLFVGLAISPALFAQYGGGGTQQQQQPPPQQQPAPGAQGQPAPGAAANPQPEAPKVDPEEEAAYKKFYDINSADAAQVISQGEAFIQKYPTSRYTGSVYASLTHAYYGKEQYDKMNAAAEKALALNPNEVDVLVLIGWIIPHNYDPNDMDANRRLDKAEDYEKRALTLIPGLTKPDNMTDDQFAKAKNDKLSMAHSGLGLVYFRKQEAENSANELKQAVSLATAPDAVDLFVLGRDLQALKRYSEAQDAYHKCGQVPGGVQDRCKQLENDMKKLAASQPPAAKP
jgi:tetratricopeptide (TPR) repeat protein